MAEGDPASISVESTCSCKIGRNSEKYSLSSLDRRLLDHRDDGASLRQLETVVNEAILQAKIQETGIVFIGDISNVYETLTDDDASVGERTELTERLSQAGVDTETLLDDFVSYQTVRTHLRDCLDVDTNRQKTLTRRDATRTIEWARSRSEGIVERTIERLTQTEGFDAGSVDVSQVIRVSCPDCRASYPVETFVERGGCECDVSE